MNNGPVITASQIYLDLLTYKSGVYSYIDGTKKFRGLQQWKIVGWDTDEQDNTYWIAENTWGTSWGEDGLIRIRAGQDKNFFGQMTFSPRPRVKVAEKEEVEEDDVDGNFCYFLVKSFQNSKLEMKMRKVMMSRLKMKRIGDDLFFIEINSNI